MRSIMAATLLAATLGLTATSPVAAAPANGAVIAPDRLGDQANDVIRVREGCGPGRHWSYRWRRCVRN